MNAEYYNKKWEAIIKNLPVGGQYRFDLRQYAYDIIIDHIKKGSKVFDYACGLGIIDIQLEKEKKCKVSGCDYSDIAIEYVMNHTKGKFKTTDKIFGTKYDYLLAIYFIEHISNPIEWLKKAFEYTKKVIIVIPNDFNRHGEHSQMQWKDWDSFNELFKDYKLERLDNYSALIPRAFRHPIFEVSSDRVK